MVVEVLGVVVVEALEVVVEVLEVVVGVVVVDDLGVVVVDDLGVVVDVVVVDALAVEPERPLLAGIVKLELVKVTLAGNKNALRTAFLPDAVTGLTDRAGSIRTMPWPLVAKA
ncbi:MAG: hypothetical protein ACYCSF_02335 [Acidimicrobiales bacterium]